MAEHRSASNGTGAGDIENQFMESLGMKHIIGLYHSWLWALEMKRRVYQDMAVFGRINPLSIKDIDKFLRDRGVIV